MSSLQACCMVENLYLWSGFITGYNLLGSSFNSSVAFSSFPPKQLFLIQTSLLQLGSSHSYKTAVQTHLKGEEGPCFSLSAAKRKHYKKCECCLSFSRENEVV